MYLILCLNLLWIVPTETEDSACDRNPCQNGGQCVDSGKDYYSCNCRPGFFGPQCQSSRDMLTVSPTHGPVSGGTLITIEGLSIQSAPSHVLLQDLYCPLTQVSSDSIVALTPNATAILVGIQLPILVVFQDGSDLNVDKYLSYLADPVIKDIYPLETILPGGTTITVEGNFLTSVTQPVLEITMVIHHAEAIDGQNITKEISEEFTEICDVTNINKMICVTPPLEIPTQFLIQDAADSERRKRHAYDRYSLIDSNRLVHHVTFKTPHGREKRQSSDDQQNYENENTEIIFYLGFLLDGVSTYTNLSANDELEKYGKLDVFLSPVFSSEQDFSDFDPGVSLHIKGNDLDRGIQKHDYQVYIGLEVCQIIDLTENVLLCLPPGSPSRYPGSQKGIHPVLVNIGTNLKVDLGYVQYPELPILLIGYVTGIGSAVIIIIVVVVIVCIRRRKKKNKKSEAESQSHDSLKNNGVAMTADGKICLEEPSIEWE